MPENKKSQLVFGVGFDLQTRNQIALDIASCEVGQKYPCRLVITPNVDHIVTLHSNQEYRKACEYAWKLTVDGFPVAVFLKLVGVDLPERSTGADLFPDIMQKLLPGKHRPCFLVATEHTRLFLESWLTSRGFDPLKDFLVKVPPFGFEQNKIFSDQFMADLEGLGATHLFMGVGAPKSEIWAYRNRFSLSNICVLCFGAGIEFFSGNLVRAPIWMQRTGFEWFWRLCSEPRRLARRYLINSWKFFFYAMKEIWRKKLRRGYENRENYNSVSALVDYSHMGRKITGIERISADLFSSDALCGLNVIHTPYASALGMIKAQWFGIPLLAAKYRRAKLLFPGFPPSIIVSLLFGDRTVPYIHDLFLLDRKTELNIRARLYMRPSFIYAIRHLKSFFVNSRVTEAALRKECMPDARVMILRPRAENIFGFEEISRHMPHDGSALKFVMLGTLEPRKNYEFAAELTAELGKKLGIPVELHISGREGWGDISEKISQFTHVNYHGYLSIPDVRKLVGESHIFLCTSLDEGLGLPLLEVLYSGIPLAISDIPVFREVASAASSVFISNIDKNDAVKSLCSALEKSEFFSLSIQKARQATQSWNVLADSDIESFHEFMRGDADRQENYSE